MMLSCRLDRNTFRREFADATCLENQVNHVRIVLYGKDKAFVDGLSYCQQTSVTDDCMAVVERLHALWMVVWENEDDHDFEYSSKRCVEKLFAGSGDDTLGGIPQPWLKSLEIIVTSRCNERCVHCYIPDAEKNRAATLDKEMVKEAIRQFRLMNGVKVNFSGGEPLLHPDIWELLDYCRQQDLMLLLNSNMIVLTEEMVERLKALRMFNIQVSLYSMCPEIHDGITGRRGSFERTCRSIEMLVDNNIPVMLSCPVMHANCHCVADVRRYADSLGIDSYFDYVMMARSDGTSDNLDGRLSVNETREVIRQIVRTNPIYMEAIRTAPSRDALMEMSFANRWNKCDIMSASLCMDADGTLFPCPGWNSMRLANIKDTTLQQVWVDSVIANGLRNVDQREFSKCRSCHLHNFCDMCPVYNANENGSVYDVCQRFCVAARLLKEVVEDIYDEVER